MDLATERRTRRQQQSEADFNEYRALLGKATDGTKLSRAEDRRLDELMGELGFTIEGLASDESALRKAAELGRVASGHDAAAAAIAAIESDASAFREREAKLLADLRSEADALGARLRVAQSALSIADTAAEKLEAIRNTHHRLLGVVDPAIVARRRHLVSVAFSGRPRDAAADVIEFEAVMASPRAFADVFGHAASGLEFVPIPGQTPADLEKLIGAARRLVRDDRPARYLQTSDRAAPVCRLDAVVAIDLDGPLTFELDGFTWLAPPGVSQADTDALVAKIAKRQKRELPRALQGAGSAVTNDWINPK